jgi:hypothetical protein
VSCGCRVIHDEKGKKTKSPCHIHYFLPFVGVDTTHVPRAKKKAHGQEADLAFIAFLACVSCVVYVSCVSCAHGLWLIFFP